MQDFSATAFQTLLTTIRTSFFPFLSLDAFMSGALSSQGSAPDLIYDDQGLLLSRIVNRDDGLRQEDSFVDGVRSKTLLLDVTDVFAWSEVVNIYDESGRNRKETTFDDGMLRVDIFQDGVRVRTFQTDPADVNTFDWTTRDVTYDDAGTPLSRLTRYDDGTERLETFQDGARATVVQDDLVLTARDWSQISAVYDRLERLTARDLIYDDGTLRQDTFSAGVRQKTYVYDEEDAFDWDSIQYLYDPDGVVTSRQQVDDNGDLTLILFEDGARSERIIVTADTGAPWAVQVTTYDDTGVSDVTNHAQRGNVLAEYAPFFAADTLDFVDPDTGGGFQVL